MADYPDQPDYQQATVPSVTRWAPGTEFGNIAWSGSVAANTEQTIYYAIPNNGYYYVIDKVFLVSSAIGLFAGNIKFCDDYGSPTWVELAFKAGEWTFEFNPFTFVSMALTYPQGLSWHLWNFDNLARTMYLYVTMYRYLASG